MYSKNRGNIHRYFYLAVVFLCFLPFWPLLRYWSRDPNRYFSKFVWVRRILSRTSSFLTGYHFQIEYQEPIDWSKTYVICPNHTSNLDIPGTILACKQDFAFVGKHELLNNPVTGIFFRTIDIPVNRKSNISGYKALKRAADYITKSKSVLIFPEGGIGNLYPPRLGEFKVGSFRLAVENNIPVIPVVIHNAWDLHWDNGTPHGSRPGTVYIDVLSPVQPRAVIDKASQEEECGRLATLIYQQMADRLEKGCNKMDLGGSKQ